MPLLLFLAMLTLALARTPLSQAEQGELNEFPSAIDGGAGGAPLKLTAGLDGQMWATESGGKVVRFGPTGNVTGEFAAPSGTSAAMPETSHPGGITVAKTGNAWFTDSGTDAEGYAFIGTISPSSKVTEFKLRTPDMKPQDIAEGSNGDLWFTESNSTETAGAIGRITTSGDITEFTVPTGNANDFSSNPNAIALGADGDMWFTDDGVAVAGFRGSVGRITPTGEFNEYPDPLNWGFPRSIAAGSDGNMWFTENEEHVVRITPEGEKTSFPVATVGGSPHGLAEGPDGNLWFTEDERTNAISRISPTGQVTEFSPVAPEGGHPFALAFDHSGNLWFGEAQASKIWRWRTPRVAVDESPPTITGEPVEGKTLAASAGQWGLEPGSFAYQWQSCSAAGLPCSDLTGETGPEHFVTAQDIGHTLRAVITAVSLGGSASAASAVSDLVTAAPLPVHPSPPDPGPAPTPVVGATMTWRFAWSDTYTLVRDLALHSLIQGETVSIACKGRGCPNPRKLLVSPAHGSCARQACGPHALRIANGQLELAKVLQGRRLGIGARILVLVTKQHWIGRSFTFTMRATRAPSVHIECLSPGSTAAHEACGA